MAKFEKGNTYGNRFATDNQPKKNGRKPKLYKYLKEQLGKKVGYELEEGDFQDIMRALLEMTPAELEKLVKRADGSQNKQTPAWILMLVSQINMCIRYGRTDALELILDRVFGRATQKVENEVTAHVVDLSGLSTEELLQYNALLEKIKKGSE